MKDTIQAFIQGHVLVLDGKTPAFEAARAMHERRVGSVLVSDAHGHVVGIVTDRDLACEVLGFELGGDTPILSVMTEEVLSVQESASLDDVVDLMERFGVRRIPVLRGMPSGRQRCLGLISFDDLIAAKIISSERAARIVRGQVQRHALHGSKPAHGEERLENTLNRLLAFVAEQAGLDHEAAEPVTFFLLSFLVRRLSSTTAAHFIAQLPRLFQEKLLDLPAGPDRSITARSTLRQLEAEFNFGHQRAKLVTRGFWKALLEFHKADNLNYLARQLPDDLRELLGCAAPAEDDQDFAPTSASAAVIEKWMA